MEFERHDLLHLVQRGRERIFAELVSKGFSEESIGEMLLPERFPGEDGVADAIPGIVRREDCLPGQGGIPVGFASWRSNESGRFRVASFARADEVAAKVTPEDVAAKLPGKGKEALKTPALKALAALREVWNFPLSLGVWGSTALEIETGRAYTHHWSDLDVRLVPGASPGSGGVIKKDTLEACLAALFAVEKSFGIRIDAELRLANRYGIALKELLSESVTVLGKGYDDVILIQKTDVFEGLAARDM